MSFDFETWSRLARENPEEFERRRREAIEEVINRAPVEDQARLRGLQFRIDMERQRSKSPLGACVRINKMMWESFGEMRQALESLKGELKNPGSGAQTHAAAATPKASAEILPFRSAR
mgnify:CR=1 FL=1|jgi:hypothetical protein